MKTTNCIMIILIWIGFTYCGYLYADPPDLNVDFQIPFEYEPQFPDEFGSVEFGSVDWFNYVDPPLLFYESPLLFYDSKEREKFVNIKKVIRERSERYIETVSIFVTPRPAVSAPGFYKAIAQYDASVDLFELQPYFRQGFRSVLVFRDIDENWKAKYTSVMSIIPTSICVIDFSIDRFDGPILEEFVRDGGATEIIIGWGRANQVDSPKDIREISYGMRGALEYAKRGNPDVFVWGLVCYGLTNTDEWAVLIRNLPFDGIALWGPHFFPPAAAKILLQNAYDWSQEKFPGKPVSLAGVHILQAWKLVMGDKHTKVEETKQRVKKNLTNILQKARDVGFSCVYYHIGWIPSRVYGVHKQ